MQARRFLLVVLIVSVMAMMSMALGVSAQTSSALQDVGTNCANVALNTTCIGLGGVSRVTSSGVVSTTFTAPGDRASINTTHRTQSTGNGVNVMKAQAGLPASAGGILYVSVGNVTATNVGGAGQAVWQNFDVAVGAGAMDFFVIQSPKNTSASISVNGAAISLGSTVCIRQVAESQIMFIVVDGELTIGPPGLAVTAPAGYAVTASLNPTGRIIPSTISGPVLATDLGACANAPLLPSNVLHYPIGQIVVVCPSGVGGAGCTVVTNP